MSTNSRVLICSHYGSIPAKRAEIQRNALLIGALLFATVLMRVSSYVRTTLMTYVIFITTMTDRNSTFNCPNQRFLAKLFKKKKYKTNLVISCNAVHSLRLSVR